MKTTTRSLFDGVPEAEKTKLDVKYTTVPRGTVIYSYGERAKNACWIIDGSARTLRTDENGFVSVIEFLGAKCLFGDYFDGDFVKGDFVEIVATTKCKIAVINFEKVEKSDFYTTIAANALELVSARLAKFTQRAEILLSRTIREKLMCYFKKRAAEEGGESFELKYTLTNLADYIFADRSAMMREIKKMKESGVIETNKKTIRLIDVKQK